MGFEFISKSAEETIEFGRKLGERLRGGEILGLVGPLGSGKTHLIKGIVQGLSAEDAANEVTSPTFVLVNEYTGRLDIFHIDAYRINSIEQFEQIGFDDYCQPGSVVLIEWADKVIDALSGIKFTKIELSHLDTDKRAIRITNAPDYVRI